MGRTVSFEGGYDRADAVVVSAVVVDAVVVDAVAVDAVMAMRDRGPHDGGDEQSPPRHRRTIPETPQTYH